MKKLIAFAALAAAMSLPAVPAQANSWGGTSNQAFSSGGLVNVSPSVQTGSLNVLNGAAIGSGNAILSGNNTGIGILGSGTGVLNNVIGNVTSQSRRK